MRKGILSLALVSAALIGGGAQRSIAQPTSTGSISFQARLEGVSNGPVSLRVQFYDAATGGNPVGAPIDVQATVSDGVVSVPLPIADPSVFAFTQPRLWAGLRVNGGTELTPRIFVTSVPHAHSAEALAGGRVRAEGPLTAVTGPLVLRNSGAGAELLRFDMDRTWAFVQGGSGAGTSLRLQDHSGNKVFEVLTQLGRQVAAFRATESTPEVWLVAEGGNVGIGTSNPAYTLDVRGNARIDDNLSVSGETVTSILRIAGADVAEPFRVSSTYAAGESVGPQPGMVVVIDQARPGDLRVSEAAYDRRVAGVISGANGLSVGVVLGHDNPSGLIRGDHPVAMSGRVWVYCDTAAGPVAPGDLLTTSDVPGHAMKAADTGRAFGAVIGKAMTELNEGRGLVLVLVNLQ